MPYRPQITWREVSPRKAVTDEIEAAAARIRGRFGDPTSFRVVISKSAQQFQDEEQLDLKLEMHLRGTDFIVTHDASAKDTGSSPETAVRRAFDVLKQQVSENLERRRQSER